MQVEYLEVFETVDWAAAVARLHPVVLHLPIGLIVALVCVELWGRIRRAPARDASRGMLLFLLATSAPLAATSGWLLHETESYGAGVEWHEYLGIALMATALGASVAYWRRSSAYGWFLTLSFLLLFPTAHLGGSLTHGDDFLTEPWSDALEARSAEPEPHTDPDGLSTSLTTDLGTNLVSDLTTEAAPGATGTFDFAPAATFFEQYCTRCHGERKRKGGLALHSMTALLAGGDGGPVFSPGDAGGSRAIELLRLPLDHDDHMPPPEKGQPSTEEIDALAAWIDGLAQGLEAGALESPPPVELDARPEQAAPEASTAAEAPNPVDANRAAIAAAVAELRARLVHVERLGAADGLLSVDFTAATVEPGELSALLAPLAPLIAELDLSATTLDGSDLAFLGDLPVLDQLDLRRLGNAALDLAPLSKAPELAVLNLAGSALGPDAVTQLGAFTELERVVLWDCGLDSAQLAALAETRPGLVVQGPSAPPSEPVEVEPEVAFERYVPEPSAELEAAPTASLEPVNDTCPVSGTPVDARYSIVHEGRVIGFCCPNCPKSYWDDPARFAAALGGG